MKSPYKYGINFVKVCLWKFRYPRKLSIGIIQTFENVRFELTGSAIVKIGNFNQNRDRLYIGVNGGNLNIGNHCFFNINGSITCLENIEIGNYCKFGNNLIIVDHDHNFRYDNQEYISEPIKIGNNVWVGANVTILRGTEIGDNSVIAAGCVVKGIIPPCSLVIGEKAKICKIKKI